MANNYSEGSFDLRYPPEKKAEAAAWYEAYSAEVTRLLEENGDEYDEKILGLEIQDQGDHYWVSGNGEYFNTDAAAYWSKDFLKAIDSPGGIFFSWSSWCSKPRVHEFDGGGCVVTQTEEFWVNAYQALEEASQAGVEVVNL